MKYAEPYVEFFPLLDPFCRTIVQVGKNNPDPDQKCAFSEDVSNKHEKCTKIKNHDEFWCPTKGWKEDTRLRRGICNNMCDKENGKNLAHYHRCRIKIRVHYRFITTVLFFLKSSTVFPKSVKDRAGRLSRPQKLWNKQ